MGFTETVTNLKEDLKSKVDSSNDSSLPSQYDGSDIDSSDHSDTIMGASPSDASGVSHDEEMLGSGSLDGGTHRGDHVPEDSQGMSDVTDTLDGGTLSDLATDSMNDREVSDVTSSDTTDDVGLNTSHNDDAEARLRDKDEG